MNEDREVVELLKEIRFLLQVMVEPQLKERHKRLIEAARQVVGTSEKRLAAVLLMDGSNTQAEIAKKVGMDAGGLSRMTKALLEQSVLDNSSDLPRLVFSPKLLES